MQASVLLDARFRQAAPTAFERLTQLRHALEAQGAGGFDAFAVRLRGVLGDIRRSVPMVTRPRWLGATRWLSGAASGP